MNYNLGNVYVVAKMFVDFSGKIAPEVNVPEIIRLAQNSEPIQVVAGASCAGMKNVEPKEIVRYLNRMGYEEKGV